jgi:hypothetical protein
LPFLAAGGAALLVGIWVGLRRAGWALPLAPGLELADHAAWLVSGFLGTLIGLERAVALRIPWTFLAPALSGLGGLLLLSGVPRALPAALFTAASVVLTLAYLLRVVRLRPAPFTVTMAAGAAAWFLGTLAWGAGLPAAGWTTAWAAFLVLTIVGERLELSRLLQLPSLAWATFRACAVLHGAAVVVALSTPWLGFRLSGLAFLAWALWLGRYDVARRTVRTPGLPRFAAVGLMAGYAWLSLAGVLWITTPGLPAGLRYDAEMHALFLGFVFSMVFAHAPIIWPSVLGGEIRFYPRFYGHLAVLHLSVLLRVASDLAAWEAGRRWAVLLNTLAILLFLANTVGMARSHHQRPSASLRTTSA